MRRARLVGLSADGRFVIVATDDGEELSLAADDRLRAAIHGHRPRLGQLEIEMESALTPREIQTRIRSGESLEDVARVAGLPLDRVERFAAPVIAEREYVAAQALPASVRRRGETSGHRNLRTTITERLAGRGVDLDELVWDAYRVEDTRWGVTASYRQADDEHVALFLYDIRSRFSVAGNDDARSVIGERAASSDPTAEAGGPEDVEPTLDLSDELAIVRAVTDPPAAAASKAETSAAEAPAAEAAQPDRTEAVEDTVVVGLAEESAVPYPGLSDASAVPEAASRRGPGWEPAIVVDYPVEPSQVEPPDEWGEELTGTDEPGPPDPTVDGAGREDEADALEDEHEAKPAEPEPEPELEAEPAEPAPKRAGRKRASVPSWDEIMFGAPKRP